MRNLLKGKPENHKALLLSFIAFFIVIEYVNLAHALDEEKLPAVVSVLSEAKANVEGRAGIVSCCRFS